MNKFFKTYNFRKYFSIFLVVILSIMFYRATEDFKIINIFPVIFGVLSPFFCGILIAYLLNAPVRFLEDKAFGRISKLKNKPDLVKRISIFTAMVGVIGVVIWIIAYIVPEIVQSFQKIVAKIMETDYATVEQNINAVITKYNIKISDETYKTIFTNLEKAISALLEGVKYIPNMVESVLGYTVSVAKALYNVIMGLVIAIYILYDKKIFMTLSRKVLYLFFEHKTVRHIIKFAADANNCFERFFVGKFIDSFIIGILFFIIGLILDLPYLMFLSLIIGVTNMIPYFGPFIGAVPVILLVLLNSPIKAVWVTIAIFILQQFDGIILGPKILGDSIGLKPIGVIFAIIVGGAVAGPLGMFFGVPIFAVIVTIIQDFVEVTYNRKTVGVNEREE